MRLGSSRLEKFRFPCSLSVAENLILHIVLLLMQRGSDIVQIFETQADGILVAEVLPRDHPSNWSAAHLQIVWDSFQYAREMSFIREYIETLNCQPVKCCWEGLGEVNHAKLLVPLPTDRIKNIERKANIKLTSSNVILLKCDFQIVREVVQGAYALFCRRWLSWNGFNDILANCTVDEETCVRWTDTLLALPTQQTIDDHAERIRRMMCVLYLQGYFKTD